MNKIMLFNFMLIASLIAFTAQEAVACGCKICTGLIVGCSVSCGACSRVQEPGTEQHFTDEQDNHKIWMVRTFFKDPEAGTAPGLLAAMMLMAEQLTTNALQQVQMIGSFFDAKHQLETQRLFQTLTARAHKDYHPSEELCAVGTMARPLAASERKSALTSTTISKRSIDRQLLSKETLEMEEGIATDQRSRLVQFIKTYCNPNDNSANLNLLCQKGGAAANEKNKDISYTSTIDLPLTLDIDFSDGETTSDEQALFALTANLIGHEAMPNVEADKLMADGGEAAYGPAGVQYLDSRALVAKRSVAMNSIASIAALKANGNPEAKPFIYALIQELSPDTFTIKEMQDLIGEEPSYYAQMEVLTKKLYQNPKFYSDLYDKPANVLRKDVAIQAAELMQKRDIYRSFLRSEAVLAVMLETALLQEQEKLKDELDADTEGGNNQSSGIGG